MRIAIDCRILDFKGAEDHFLGAAIMPYLLLAGSEHHFFLVFDQSPPPAFKGADNVTILVLKPMADNAAARALWYDLRLPALLSGHKIDLFLGTAGYISLRSPVKQVLLLHDALSGEWAPAATGWPGSWYRRRLPSMLEKACFVISGTGAQLHEILPEAKTGKTTVIPASACFAMGLLPDESRREEIKGLIADGAEFLLCREGWQTIDDGIELLLAFSTFKKRQHTGMKLVLMGQPPAEKAWEEKLGTFRYREDVIVMPTPVSFSRQNEILCAAYALIHLPAGAKLSLVQSAFYCRVPVITWPLPAIREIAGDAALYCTDSPGETVAQNMMRIYKDEKMRLVLIEKGRTIAGEWDPETVARKILACCIAAI